MTQDSSKQDEREKAVNAFVQHRTSEVTLTECQECERLREERDFNWDKIQKCLHILHEMDKPNGPYRRAAQGNRI